MRVIVCNDYEEMSLRAAKLVASQIILKPNCVLGLAKGSTPIGLYDNLVKMYEEGEIDFSDVTSFNLDEYYPLSPDNDQSYRYFMNKHLFDRVNIDIKRTHVPNGLAEDTDAECLRYEGMINAVGGVDLQILGIGQNGHIGFNEPDANLNTITHLTDLTKSTIDANSRFFEKREDVPTKAITMGMASILKSKKIVLLASGRSKAAVVAELLKESINTNVPATLLNVHNDVVLICDKEAYAGMSLGIDIGGTSVKFGVVDGLNEIVYKDSIPTEKNCSDAEIIDSIADKCAEIATKFPISSVGVGTPGLINYETKTVSASNLPFKNTPLVKMLEKKLRLPVFINNDANCAALGEATSGVGKDVKNMVMVTLGTGIGGGIIIDKKIYLGRGEAGEIGHMCIEADGKKCACGAVGCWERYASATALIEMTKEAAEKEPDSLLAKVVAKNGADGKAVFEAIEKGCGVGKAVLDKYLNYLAVGIKNIVNVFSPELIVISGGLSEAGEALAAPLKEKLGSNVDIQISALGNDAGIIGAALLCRV
ncbi:MAG: glucosamine-6-phosphate deaminase [Clostridia bacterium]|nr:glucosamine-6-phosphate deaminase [Clostridia bacterium]